MLEVFLEEFHGYCLEGLMRSDDLTRKFEWVSWRHENVCETSCHRSTCLAPPFFDIFVLCFHFDAGLYAMHVQTWSNMSKSKSKWWLQNVSALLFGGCTAFVTVWASFRIPWGKRSSF